MKKIRLTIEIGVDESEISADRLLDNAVNEFSNNDWVVVSARVVGPRGRPAGFSPKKKEQNVL